MWKSPQNGNFLWREGELYYLVEINSKPVSAISGVCSEFKDIPHILVFRHVFHYAGPYNKTYTMLYPVEVHTEPVTDLVKQAKTVLMNELGRSYFQKYFSKPRLYQESFENDTWKYLFHTHTK